MAKKKLTKEEKLERKRQKKENGIGFGSLMLWQSSAVSKSISVLLMTYLMLYCTDTLGIPAAAVSLILVLSKVVDGVTDAFAGFIVDKTETKWGKGRPYEVFIVGLWLATWLMFSCPTGFKTTAKIIWIFVMYVLVNAVCSTFLNANQTPYVVRAFKEQQIVKLTSYGSFVTMGASVIFNIVFPGVMGKFATSPAGWSTLVGMLAVPMAAIGLLRMIFVPEKYEVEVKTNTDKDKIKVRDAFKVIKTNKYILILALMTLVFNVVANMGITQYYFKYIVGNIGLMGLTAISTIIVLPLVFIFPKLIQKYSTVTIMRVGFVIAALGYLVNFIAYDNMPLLMVGSILTGGGTVPASMLIALAVLECAEYNEWKGNHRMEGTMSSIIGLAGKIGAALGTAVVGVLLSAVGYDGTAAQITNSAMVMIRMLNSLIPMALYILTSLTLLGYKKLDKQMPQIKKENEENRAAAKAKLEAEAAAASEN
jgi:Na+/melibiose symporter-like transporter